MADDTNIDDILRSIDALLKESEGEEERDHRSARKRHEATNDEEPVDPADVDGKAEPALEDIEEIVENAEGMEADASDDALVEAVESEAEEVLSEPKPVAEHEAVAGPEKVVKRIVLSEDMLVEDTPDLLAFAEQSEPDKQDDAAEQSDAEPSQDEYLVETQDIPDEERVEDEGPDDAWQDDEPLAVQAVPDEELFDDDQSDDEQREDVAPESEVPAAPTLDADLLIVQISDEIHARIQDMLPALVEEVVRKHIAAQQPADIVQSESENDTQSD